MLAAPELTKCGQSTLLTLPECVCPTSWVNHCPLWELVLATSGAILYEDAQSDSRQLQDSGATSSTAVSC